MKILLDNGHGQNTAGKRSPDGVIREYLYARNIAEEVERRLRSAGYDAERIVREAIDVPLSERVRRVNEVCGKMGASKVLLVSIHLNAAGNGAAWMHGRGWEVFVSPNASRRSKQLASCLAKAATDGGFALRVSTPEQAYKVNDLAVCRDTKCAAVLTENLFMDNSEDAALLQTKECFDRLVKLHVEGIINYISA